MKVDYPEIIEALRPYPYVIVTGPQRSGTHFAAKVIALRRDNEPYVEEGRFQHANLKQVFSIAETQPRAVFQAPALSHVVHQLGDRDDWAAVFMLRNTKDVIASGIRNGWEKLSKGWTESRYQQFWPGKYNASTHPAEYKYYVWIHHQRNQLRHGLELPYESLASDPLWIPVEEREARANEL